MKVWHLGDICSLFGWKSVEVQYACKLIPPNDGNIHWLMENDHSGGQKWHVTSMRVLYDGSGVHRLDGSNTPFCI
jgi:hypothetical protein